MPTNMLRRVIAAAALLAGVIAVAINNLFPGASTVSPVSDWILVVTVLWFLVSFVHKGMMLADIHRSWEVGLVAVGLAVLMHIATQVAWTESGMIPATDSNSLRDIFSFLFLFGWPVVDFLDVLAKNFHYWET